MPVSSSTEHWIKPDALTINLNHFGDPDYLQVSVLAGAVVMAFKQDVITYNAAHNYRTWTLEAANTYLETTSAYNVYARCTRSEVGASALVIYDPVLRDMEGREISYKTDEETGEEVEVLGEADETYFYLFLGQISASVDESGSSVARAWEISFRFGSLSTNQYQNEETGGEWTKMFRLNKVTDMIEVLKTFSSAVFGKLSIKKNTTEKSITDIKRSIDSDNEYLLDEDGNPQTDDSGNPIKDESYVPVSDSTLATSLYVDRRVSEVESDKFLRKDQDDRTPYGLTVGGTLTAEQDFVLGGKRIASVTRYYDEEKPAQASDAEIYSALMTDERIKEEMTGLNDKYLRKDKEDTAHKRITFEEGITVYDLARMMNLEVEELATIARAIVTTIGSSTFVDGFAGEGYQIWKDIATGDWSLTLDRITVRKVMMIYELVIQKIRAVGGMIVVSAGNGKVKEVSREGIEYKFTFEDTNTFVVNDLMRCQVFSASGLKYYWVEVTRVVGEDVYARVADFNGVVPAVGDECVLMGNTKNTLRQNLILISATEDGKPRFDCLDGVKTKSFEGCLKVRVGCLDGITDDRFPSDSQPQGYGLYGNNCYLTGVFVLSNGVDVKTQFTIMEGMIRSEVSSVRAEINAKDNYLSNASFSSDLEYWEFENDVRVFNTSGGLLHFNGNFYSIKNNFAGVVVKDSKNVLRIKNSYIMQKNADYNLHPSFDLYTDEETGEELYRPRMFYVSFKYLCTAGGTMKACFKDEENDGTFEPYTSVSVEKEILPNVTFTVEEFEGKWNGTGDFYLSFDGDIYIYDLALSDNALADVEEKFTTRFEQTDRRITLEAARITANEDSIAQIKVDANSLTLRVKDVEGRASSLELRTTSVETRVTTVEGDISRLQVEDDRIKASVSANNTGIASLQVRADEIEASVGSTNDRIDALNDELGDTSKAVEDLDDKVDEFEEDVYGYFKDGIIEESEAISIEKYLNSIASMMNGIEATYDKVYAHEYLTNPEKSALRTAFKALSSEYDNLVGVIEDAIYDGKATEAEKEEVSDAFSDFDDAIADYNDALQDARDCITGFFAKKATEVAEQALYDALPEKWQDDDGTYASSLVKMAMGLSAVAGRFNDDGTLIEGSGWTVTSDMVSLWSKNFNDDGELVSEGGVRVSDDMSSLFNRMKDAEAKVKTSVQYDPETGKITSAVTISADQINLTGVVTYNMLNQTLQKTLDDKATSSDLENAQSVLNTSITTLNSTVSELQDEVNLKASTESLNSKVTELNDALNSKADTDLANAVINGSTLIVGGFINTDFIQTKTITAEKLNVNGILDVGANSVTIGGFSVDDDSISISTGWELTGTIDNFTMELTSQGITTSYANGAIVSRFGQNYVSFEDWGSMASVSIEQAATSTAAVNYHQMLGLHVKGLSNDMGILVEGAGINIQPDSGAHSVIYGLSVHARKTSGTLLTNDDFIVTSGNVVLPSAASNPGKIIFVRCTSNSHTITSSSTIYGGSSDAINGDASLGRTGSFFFISNGTSWYAFNCYYAS